MPSALVIDDEAALTKIVGRFLERAGFRVETATSGPEGLQKARAKPHDVIVVDVMMPNMDGYEVCRQLRRDPRTIRTAIVMLTARGQYVDKQMAFQSGADEHISKPFNGKVLVQEIEGLLERKDGSNNALGYQILVLRLKDQVGATTLATNLSLCLAGRSDGLTVTADMVLQGGDVGTRLGLRPTTSWVEAPRMDSDTLVDHLVRYQDGLFVLPAPKPQQVGRLDLAIVDHHLERLRSWSDYVVVDTPRDLGRLAPVLLRSSHLVLLLLTPDPAVLRTAQASLAAMKRLGHRSLRVWPLLHDANGAQPSVRQKVEGALGMQVVAALPWSPEVCAQAIARHQPVVQSAPGSALAQAFQALARDVVQVAQESVRRRSEA